MGDVEGAGEILAGARRRRLGAGRSVPAAASRSPARGRAPRARGARRRPSEPATTTRFWASIALSVCPRSAARSTGRATPATFCGFSLGLLLRASRSTARRSRRRCRGRGRRHRCRRHRRRRSTKPPPRATARNTNIHFAWRRSRGKNIVSSIDGAVERLTPRGAATAAFCFGRFVLLLSNRAIATFLSGSALRRPPE